MSNYIKVLPAVSTPIGATLMKTGMTTSYRTGDDGDLEVGRASDFFTLPSNNPFGNNRRFTGTTGGYQTGGVNYDKDGVVTTIALAFPNDIVIDWSTTNNAGTSVLMYTRAAITGNVNWNTAIDTCLAYSVGIYTSGWRLMNRNEAININNVEFGYNYNPFNLTGVYQTSSSTTVAAIKIGGIQSYLDSKTNSNLSIAVRLATISGTTLT
jgi:hypothetical protein